MVIFMLINHVNWKLFSNGYIVSHYQRKSKIMSNIMAIKNIYGMTDEAIAEELGQRIEKIRLSANKSQQEIADEVGITRTTYRKLIRGQTKFHTLIAVLRALNELTLVDEFIPERPFSPMALLELEGKQRKRASKTQSTRTSSKTKSHPLDSQGESEW